MQPIIIIGIIAMVLFGTYVLATVTNDTFGEGTWNDAWLTPYKLLYQEECWITGEPQVCEIDGEQMYIHGGFSIDMDLKECVEDGLMGSEAYDCMFAKKQEKT